jgi:MFS family permease
MAALKHKKSLTLARLAVAIFFFINGGIFFNWATRIPQVKDNLGFSEGTLGFALLGISAGVISGLLLAGGLIERFSSRRVTLIATLLFCAAFSLIGLTVNFITLVTTLYLMGFCGSIMDMAMNTQASEIERRLQRPVMSSFHGMFSMGGIVGGFMGAAAVSFSLSVFTHFLMVAILFIIIGLIAGTALVTIEGEAEGHDAPVISLPSPAVWALGAGAFSAAIGEGSMIDWSALYLKDIVGTNEAFAAYGLIAFSTLMTIGRFAGDWLVSKFSAEILVRGGGVLGASGLLLAMVIPQPLPVLIGFGFVGAGMSIIIPLAFSAAGNIPGIPSGTGIAGVATIGYAGFLAGPPLIGLLAEATTLRVATTFVLVLTYTLFFSGRAIRKAKMPAG